MTDYIAPSPTITHSQEIETSRGIRFAVNEFDTTRYLLSVRASGSLVQWHFTAEDWGQFQAMVSEFGSPTDALDDIDEFADNPEGEFDADGYSETEQGIDPSPALPPARQLRGEGR